MDYEPLSGEKIMIAGSSYRIIGMRPEHLAGLMRLKSLARWNQTEADWLLFIERWPEHAFAAVHQDEIVGSAAAVNYDNRAAWIGMVLVDPEHRRRGIAGELMRTVIRSLPDCRSIGLDATPAGRPVYAGMGFTDGEPLTRYVAEKVLPPSRTGLRSVAVTVAGAEDFGVIAALDRRLFHADRAGVLERFFHRAPHLALVAGTGPEIAGFCLGRPGERYTQIGPVAAASAPAGDALLEQALIQLRGSPALIDLPSRHLPAWGERLCAAGFVEQRSFTRMYLRNCHPIDMASFYAAAGPEFG
jgi:GNAT superfamily N-acetyltransferase